MFFYFVCSYFLLFSFFFMINRMVISSLHVLPLGNAGYLNYIFRIVYIIFFGSIYVSMLLCFLWLAKLLGRLR